MHCKNGKASPSNKVKNFFEKYPRIPKFLAAIDGNNTDNGEEAETGQQVHSYQQSGIIGVQAEEKTDPGSASGKSLGVYPLYGTIQRNG
jgi:hypothetical protein